MAFLVFEGLDGSGKSTLIQSLAQRLRQDGRELILTREPGGTPLAEEIRNLLLRTGSEVPAPRTELLLYEAARAQHVEHVIRPALQLGTWVLCDRFTASTVAFQSFARSLPRAETDWLNHYATAGLRPDLTVLLDLPVAVSLQRLRQRSHTTGQEDDRLEQEASAFHEAVRLGYLTQAREEPDRWIVLDACESRDVIFKKLIDELEKRQWLASSTK